MRNRGAALTGMEVDALHPYDLILSKPVKRDYG